MVQTNYVLDVNIYTSFVIGKKLFRLAAISETGINIYTSPSLLAELTDVLNRPKIKKHLPNLVTNYTRFVENITEVVADKIVSRHPIYSPDKDDNYLFQLALQTGSVLVTGDKELLYWKNSPVAVISLTSFLKLF